MVSKNERELRKSENIVVRIFYERGYWCEFLSDSFLVKERDAVSVFDKVFMCQLK